MLARLIARTYFLFATVAFFAAPYVLRSQQPDVKSNASNAPVVESGDNEYTEDFTKLSLQGSRFFPLDPALGQRDDDPKLSFTRERWQLFWRPADAIDFYLCKPKGVSKPPVVLYLYSSPGTTERFKSDDWCTSTTADGVAAAGFVSAYTGHRLENRNPKITFFSEFQESLVASVHDVQLILNYLASRGDLDMTRVGMFGQGSGGAIAILASATDSRIKALDLLTPWGDWPQFFAKTRMLTPDARQNYTKPEFLGKVAPLDPVDWLGKVKANSIRLQDVRKTSPMPDGSQERMEAAAPQRVIINQFGDSSALVPHAGALFTWIHGQLHEEQGKAVAVEDSERVHIYPSLAVNPLPPIGLPEKTANTKN